MVEGVTPVIPLSRQIAVPIRAFREPQRRLRFSKFHRRIFDQLVVPQEAYLRHRTHHIRFHRQDLRTLYIDPGAPLQSHRERHSGYVIHTHLARLVGPLTEMYYPRGFAAPLAASFARKTVLIL